MCVCVCVPTFLTPLTAQSHNKSFTERNMIYSACVSATHTNWTTSALLVFSARCLKNELQARTKTEWRVCPHLKLRPVHAHARPVGVPPPSEIFSVIGCSDGLTQVSVQVLEPVGHRDKPKFAACLCLCQTGQDTRDKAGLMSLHGESKSRNAMWLQRVWGQWQRLTTMNCCTLGFWSDPTNSG